MTLWAQSTSAGLWFQLQSMYPMVSESAAKYILHMLLLLYDTL